MNIKHTTSAPSSTRPKVSMEPSTSSPKAKGLAVESLASDYASRFDRLRQSPTMKRKAGPSFPSGVKNSTTSASASSPTSYPNEWDRPASPKMYPFSFSHAPLVENPSFERCVRYESASRGGFFHYLAADYDLHRRCALPPQQARFEASFINVKPYAVDGTTSGGDVRVDHHHHHEHGEHHHEHHHNQDSAHHHHHHHSSDTHSQQKAHALRDIESFYFHRGDDFYHLAADYDLHRRCGLPSEETRFIGSFLDMPSWWGICHTDDEKDRCEEELSYWTRVDTILKELHNEYPHLAIKI